MSIAVEVINTSWGGSTSSQIADLGRRLSALEAARTVIEAGTITSGSIAANSITSTEIAAGTIQASDIATGTITATQIAAGTITASNIASGTITATQIAAGTITATQIAAGSITTGNIAAGAITSALISAGAINAGHIQAASIDASKLVANTITAGQIAAGTITSAQIAAGTILAGNIAAATITATQIAATTILGSNIAAGTITASNISSHTITAAVIAAGTITATEIASATITGGLIAATTITAANIASGTITSTQLAANSVTSTQIISGAVDATKISVTSLSAISANLGSITAGTITGATVQTAASGSRVVLNTGGITAYNTGGTPVLAFDTSTGNLTLSGTVTANSSSVLPVAALTGGYIGSGSLVSDGGFENSTLAAWTNNANVALTGAGASTPFVPTDISGLEVWGKPETLGANGSAVASWTNSGSGAAITQGTAGNRPTVVTGALDGYSAVNFDGTDDSLNTTVAADATRTVFVVGKQAANTSGRRLWGFAASWYNIFNNAGAWAQDVAGGTANIGGTTTNYSVVSSRLNSVSSVDAYVNGGSAVNGDPNDNYATQTTIHFGQAGNGGSFWNGHIVEILVYDSALSDADRLKVLGYLAAKYPTLGTFGTPPVSTPMRSGARGGVMTSAAAGNMSILSARAVVQASQNHTAAAWFKAGATSRTVRVHISWYTANDAFISTSSSTATTTDNTATFTRTVLTAQAPATAAYARVMPEVVGAGAANEIHYVDDVTLQSGDIAADSPSIPQNTIIGNMIVADEITAREIAASSITAVEIATGTITAGNIATGTITAAQIAAGTITATQLSATAIDTMTLTGATIRTNANAQVNQVILDSLGLRAYGDLLATPTGLTLGTATGSGSLATGTYYYRVAARNQQGETLASTESSVAVTSPNRVTVTFNTVPGATSYRIYRGTSAGAENVYYTLLNPSPTAATQTFIDSGAANTAGTPASSNTAITIPINVTTTGLGTITGATVQSSEVHPKVILDRTGLRLTDSSGTDVVRLDTADGLTMRSFGGSYGAISFIDPASNTAVSSITSSAATITLQNNPAAGNASVSTAGLYAAAARNDTVQVQTSLLVQSATATLQGVVKATPGISGGGLGPATTIIDGGGASSFLQHISTSTRKFNMGQPGTGGFSNGNEITGSFAHGLGGTPVGAILMCGSIATFSPSGTSVVSASVESWDATNITYRARILNGSSNNSTGLYFLAWR